MTSHGANIDARNGDPSAVPPIDEVRRTQRDDGQPFAEAQNLAPSSVPDPVDIASEGSFPASDPPPWTLGIALHSTNVS